MYESFLYAPCMMLKSDQNNLFLVITKPIIHRITLCLPGGTYSIRNIN